MNYLGKLTKDDQIQLKINKSELRDEGKDLKIANLILSFTFQNVGHVVGNISKN